MANTNLTAERLRELLHYNPDTGIFTRLVGKWRNYPVGYRNKFGHICITIEPYRLLAHRVAWIYMTSEWPKYNIDHIDGNPSNNIFSNLRDVPQQINLQNIREAQKNSISGIAGIRRSGKKWTAAIYYDGKSHYLGMFSTSDEAYSAYIKEKRLHHSGCTI